MTCAFKYDMRNLVNFDPTNQKSENLFSMVTFCPKYTKFEQQKYRRVIFHDTERWCKVWINPDLVVSKMVWGIGWTFIRAFKSLKNGTLMGSFCLKHIIFQLENFIEIMCHDMTNFKGKLTLGLKNDQRNLVNFHVSSQKSENLHFTVLILSKTYKVLDEKVQKKSDVSWHWRVTQSLKKSWLLVKWQHEFSELQCKQWQVTFAVPLLLKVYVWVKKTQRSYVS